MKLARATGLAAVLGVLLIVAAPLAAVILRAEGFPALRSSDWSAIRFTVLQALASATVSVALAIPIARALARRRFAGRRLVIALLGAPFLLPVVVAVMGLIALFGRSGPINATLAAMNLPEVSVYGAHGVVLAHVFLNLPLAARLILQGWSEIPAERFRLAGSLGFSSREINRFLERPMLRSVLPGAFLSIFLVCLTSFAVALTLGGGPRATTVELAIYQSFRFEFDLARASALAAMQGFLGLVVTLVALRIAQPSAFGAGADRPTERWDGAALSQRARDVVVIAGALLFLMGPLASVALAGLRGLGDVPSATTLAVLRSLVMALASTLLAVGTGLAIAIASADRNWRMSRWLEVAGTVPLVASPLVMGTGLFLILRSVADPALFALPVTVAVNAVAALPFVLRALIPAARTAEADYGRLSDSLGLQGSARLRHVILPRLRSPIGFSAGLTAALSIGDLGVIALYSDPTRPNLPMLIYQLMGAYRMEAAAGVSLILLAMSFGIFALFDMWGRRDA